MALTIDKNNQKKMTQLKKKSFRDMKKTGTNVADTMSKLISAYRGLRLTKQKALRTD